MSGLFSLAVDKPKDTETRSYVTFGPTFGRKKFYQFIEEFEKSTEIKLDSILFSHIVLEKTTVDGQPYYELSLNENVFLPIAGRQSSILKRKAYESDMSIEGFADTFNFILNDSRIYQ